ncbi:MAG TPA: hypothetical protein VIG62_15895 [Blastocatellia bacterium]
MAKRMLRPIFIAWVWAVMVAMLALSVYSEAEGVKKRVRFARGETSAAIEGSVIRGERDTYLLGARAGQSMTVRVTSLEENAVFQIYEPGGKKALKGAGETDDATNWSGELPVSGDYRIVVGPTRGNASYKLEVNIK